MRLSIIVAIAENNAIGLGNRLLYHLPADLRRFKQLTIGHTVLMGSNTFRSLPKGALPNRLNVVLSRKGASEEFPNCLHFKDLSAALDSLNALAASGNEQAQEVFVIGGAQVYHAALPLVHRLCLTQIHDTPPEADTFFPPVNPDEWRETFRERHEADEKHAVPFTFIDLERK